MKSFIDILNFAISASGLTLAALGLILAIASVTIEKRFREYIIIFYIFLFLYISADMVSQISLVFLGPGHMLLSKVAIFLESLFSSFLLPLMVLILLHIIGEDWKKSRLFKAVSFLGAVYIILLVFTQYSELIYYLTDDNVYHRGPIYPVLLLPPFISSILIFFAFYRFRDKLSLKQRKIFQLCMLLPAIAMIIQALVYGLLVIIFAVALASLIIFYFILEEQVDKAVAQMEINSRQQADIMLLQMRPHFIYNTLSSIYYLCDIDPKKAQQTIGDFTTYLRKNFTALAKHDPIAFTEELTHTKAYLSVEKTRYDDLLNVVYDIKYTNFRIPPLTLQPIVENAVKYGVDPELLPQNIIISSYEDGDGITISVEDSGPGYSPEEDNEVHVGLNNVRKRLELMCNATLKIEPGRERGTVVTIHLPAGKKTSPQG